MGIFGSLAIHLLTYTSICKICGKSNHFPPEINCPPADETAALFARVADGAPPADETVALFAKSSGRRPTPSHP